jgi:hypothetical protein
MKCFLPLFALALLLTGCGAAGTMSDTTPAPPPGKCLVIRSSDGVGISCNYGGHQ